jgi:thiol-disulfide isomerase/thioredoxin
MATSNAKKKSAAPSGRPAGLFTWIAVGLVVLIVAGLVVIKISSGTSATTTSSYQASDAQTVSEVTTVPMSVFNTVGATSTVSPVTAPQALKGAPAYTGISSTGAKVPAVLYIGAEYCPFCAAQRWATIVALSRFGTWSGLGDMESSTLSGEVYPGTPTFTFVNAKYSSKYLAFQSVEEYNNIFNSSLNYYSPLQKPTAAQQAIFKKYDTSNYINGITSAQDGSIPFISFANQYLVSGASYSPATLTGLTRSQIAQGLTDPTSPVTAAIVASANEESAALCVLTKQQPSNVCTSPGVKAGAKAAGIA